MANLIDNINQVNADMQSIKSKITELGVEMPEGTKTELYADKIDEVYEAGKKAQNDEYWKLYLNGGDEVPLHYAFAYKRNIDKWFYPTIDIKPTKLEWGFRDSTTSTGKADFDLSARLKECGVKLNLSKCNQMTYLFYNCPVTVAPEVDLSSFTADVLMFGAGSLRRIDNIIVNPNAYYTKTFGLCGALTYLRITGTIGKSFVISSATKLDKESITSIIEELSIEATDMYVSFSKTAVNTAFGINVDDETTYPEGSEYYTLRHSKDNWTFNYL